MEPFKYFHVLIVALILLWRFCAKSDAIYTCGHHHYKSHRTQVPSTTYDITTKTLITLNPEIKIQVVNYKQKTQASSESKTFYILKNVPEFKNKNDHDSKRNALISLIKAHQRNTAKSYSTTTLNTLKNNPLGETKIQIVKYKPKSGANGDEPKIFYVLKKLSESDKHNNNDAETKRNILISLINGLESKTAKTHPTVAMSNNPTSGPTTNLYNINNGHHFVYNIKNYETHRHHHYDVSGDKDHDVIDFVPLPERRNFVNEVGRKDNEDVKSKSTTKEPKKFEFVNKVPLNKLIQN